MRTNIVIDPRLIASAMSASGAKTKKRAVEEGLKLLAARATPGRHPAYGAWLRNKTRFTRSGSRMGDRLPRSSDPLREALDAKYRR